MMIGSTKAHWFVRMLMCAALSLAPKPALAQAAKNLGLVMAFPPSAGLHWQVNQRLALRADASFDQGRVEQMSSSTALFISGVEVSRSTRTTEFRHSTFGLGVSGLVTVARYDQLRLYVAPRLAWRRMQSSFSTDDNRSAVTSALVDFSDSTTTNGLEIEGALGATYQLSDRFSVFGETGLGFTSPTSTSSSSGQTTSYSIGSRANLGVVIHF